MIVIEQYIDPEGRNLFDRWFSDLDLPVRARVTVALEKLERGNMIAKSVGGGVMEVRIDFGPGYRIYLGRDGDTLIILLGGGSKKRQSLDIAAAQLSWREYKQGRRAR